MCVNKLKQAVDFARYLVMRRILPSITSMGKTESGWRQKIAEVQSLGLKEFALFVTCLRGTQRQECFTLLSELKKVHHFEIPFVHAVSEMHEDEFWFLHDNFGTERFNLHPVREFPLLHPLSAKVREKIYIENSTQDAPLCREDIEGFAGLCVDLSHLEDLKRISTQGYAEFLSMSTEYQIGANHISAVKPFPTFFARGAHFHSDHVLHDVKDLAYLSTLPRHLFSDYCAIELENSLAEQVQLISVVKSAIEQAPDLFVDKKAA